MAESTGPTTRIGVAIDIPDPWGSALTRRRGAAGDPQVAYVPAHVTLQVTSSEPGVKGDTASGASKPATLSTGATINVPLFINEGEWVKVDTRSGDYLERVNRR